MKYKILLYNALLLLKIIKLAIASSPIIIFLSISGDRFNILFLLWVIIGWLLASIICFVKDFSLEDSLIPIFVGSLFGPITIFIIYSELKNIILKEKKIIIEDDDSQFEDDFEDEI